MRKRWSVDLIDQGNENKTQCHNYKESSEQSCRDLILQVWSIHVNIAPPCDVADTVGPGQTDFLHLLWIACLQMKISKHFSNFLIHWSSHAGHFWQWNLRRDQKPEGGILRKIFLSDEKSPETKPCLHDLCSLDVIMGGHNGYNCCNRSLTRSLRIKTTSQELKD